MKSTMLSGRFVRVHNGMSAPCRGRVRFVPSRLWVNEDDQAWATMAPEVDLDENGEFEVELTPTHGHDDWQWHYRVECPIGQWTIQVAEVERQSIKNLLPTKFRG